MQSVSVLPASYSGTQSSSAYVGAPSSVILGGGSDVSSSGSVSGAHLTGTVNSLGATLVAAALNAPSALNNLLASTNTLASLVVSGITTGNVSGADAVAAVSTTNTASTHGQVADVERSSVSRTLRGGISAKGSFDAVETKELAKGALLMAATKPTVIETPFGTVAVAKNALALIISDSLGLSVYDLDDTKNDAVTVQNGNEKISLRPGRHVTLTSHDSASFEEVNPVQTLGYRMVASRKLQGGLKMHSSEFSVTSALTSIQPLAGLLKSNDTADRKVGAHMLKTAVLLNLMGSNRTPFELKNQPAATAMR